MYPNPLYVLLESLLSFISTKNIFNSTSHNVVNSGNPFAEGGPSKHELVVSRVVTLFSNIFSFFQNPVL
jgi:hypothetical protein